MKRKERHGHSEKYDTDYDFTILYANLENGVQEQIVINNELAKKIEKGNNFYIIYKLGFRNRASIENIEIGENK